jgi:hypothetical protein
MSLAFPIRDYSEHSWTFPADTRLCTKSGLCRKSWQSALKVIEGKNIFLNNFIAF